ncbi:MAG: acetyltransferase [Clostridiales Family XIII bacterium]|jgi:acetyltransferase-like isoleucine patch superfamily enzyme|nr:acetyltransferase [Clostridiales Family XIII bacterium]
MTKHKDVFIHGSAHVSDDALIGEGTKVWVNAQIREHARIGKDCVVGKDAYVDHGVEIGDNVKIQNGVSVFSGVTLEDDVFVGPNAAFTNDHNPRAKNADWEITPTLIRRGASLGANCTIVCGHNVGEHAMVGAGSVVTKDVAPYDLVAGNPALRIGRVCKCGARADDGVCPECGYELP